MTTTSPESIAATAQHAARTAGAFLRQAFLAANIAGAFPIEEKRGYADVVTQVDRDAEALIRRTILDRFPDARIVGEECGAQGDGGTLWYVDPLDGTSNFVDGLPLFCVSIAAFSSAGEPLVGIVHDPMRDELFAATPLGLTINGEKCTPPQRSPRDREASILLNLPREGAAPTMVERDVHGTLLASFRSVRRLGSAALQLAYVAAGRASVGLDRGCGLWDIAAGLQLVQAAGGQIQCSDPKGSPVADPLRNLDRIHTVLVAAAGFDLDHSAARAYLAP